MFILKIFVIYSMSGSTETTYNITSRTDYDGDIIDVTINGTSFATIIHNDIVSESESE